MEAGRSSSTWGTRPRRRRSRACGDGRPRPSMPSEARLGSSLRMWCLHRNAPASYARPDSRGRLSPHGQGGERAASAMSVEVPEVRQGDQRPKPFPALSYKPSRRKARDWYGKRLISAGNRPDSANICSQLLLALAGSTRYRESRKSRPSLAESTSSLVTVYWMYSL